MSGKYCDERRKDFPYFLPPLIFLRFFVLLLPFSSFNFPSFFFTLLSSVVGFITHTRCIYIVYPATSHKTVTILDTLRKDDRTRRIRRIFHEGVSREPVSPALGSLANRRSVCDEYTNTSPSAGGTIDIATPF